MKLKISCALTILSLLAQVITPVHAEVAGATEADEGLRSGFKACEVLACCKLPTGSYRPSSVDGCLKNSGKVVDRVQCQGDNAVICCSKSGSLRFSSIGECTSQNGSQVDWCLCAEKVLNCLTGIPTAVIGPIDNVPTIGPIKEIGK